MRDRSQETSRKVSIWCTTLHWWLGFRERHLELTLHKAESVDRDRVDNAYPEIIHKYFDVIKETLETNAVHNRMHLIFNGDDKAAIVLNKTSRKVVVSRTNIQTHTVTNASTQPVLSVLCCVAVAGTAIPSLIVLRKGVPAGRGYEKECPINAVRATMDLWTGRCIPSGFPCFFFGTSHGSARCFCSRMTYQPTWASSLLTR